MEEITPEQKAYLETFAGKRDAALLEISNLRNQSESLASLNKLLAASNTEIQTQVQQAVGRLTELDKIEKEYDDVVSGSLTKHLIEKTRLESEVTNLQKLVAVLTPQKESLQKDISSLTEIFNTVNNRVGVLDKVVDHVTRISEQNSNTIESLVSGLKLSLKELTDINESNVIKTNQVLDKLPKMLVELQRTHLIKNKI